MRFIFLSFLFLLPASIFANTDNKEQKYHNHHSNEIGIANSLLYIPSEKEFAYGIHTHYIRYIAHTKFGYGVGYERIFGEHKHNTVGIIGSYNPFSDFYFSAIPGITFDDKVNRLDLALHLEILYEFGFNDFHIGPTLGCSFNPVDNHISFGIHIAYAFK